MVNREGVAQPVARVPSFTRRHPISFKAAQSLHRVVLVMMMVVVMVVMVMVVMVVMVRGFFGQGFGNRGYLSHLHRRDSRRHAGKRRRLGQARETKEGGQNRGHR